MPRGSSTYLGYLMNVSKTIEDVLRRSSEYRSGVQLDGLTAWAPSMLYFAADTYRRESGVRSIETRTAWLGNGRTSFIWVLPPQMRKKSRSPEDEKRLQHFKSLIGSQSDPMIFHTVNEPEPLLLRRRDPLTEDVEEMLWERCCNRFESGHVSVELLQDMTMLAV
jgi:hypothetical protein